MAQPPRFAARSRILADNDISDGAARLYLMLDDESHGQIDVFIKQLRLGALLGISVRELRRRVDELSAAGYLNLRRTGRSNVFELGYEKRTVRSDQGVEYRTVRSDQMGPGGPVVPYKQELLLQEMPGESLRDEKPEHPALDDRCLFCAGGWAGTGSNRSKCGVCLGTSKRPTIAFERSA